MLNALLVYGEKDLDKFGWVICFVAIFSTIILGFGIIIWCQPQSQDKLPFKVSKINSGY